MTKVLIITGLLPVAEIADKKNENDILLVTENEITKRNPLINFRYFFIFPHANRLISKFSAKWSSYCKLKKLGRVDVFGKKVDLLPVYLLPKKLFIRNFLVDVSLWLYRKRIQEVIEDFTPTVIHAQGSDTEAYIARRLSRRLQIPYVVTLRGLNMISDDKVRRNLTDARSLIAVSPLQRHAGSKLVNRPIELLPHGVNSVFFKDSGKSTLSPGQPIRLVTVARLLALKNIDLVIRILSLYKDDFVLDIFGEGPEKKNLKKLISDFSLGNSVRLRGQINNTELSEIMSDYDCFIMPSYPETLGRVYFEAMASGLPVIASRNTGIDGIIADGKEGFLINHNSEQELKTVLEQIKNNPLLLNAMGQEARRLANNFHWDTISEKYVKIYTGI